MQGFMQKMEIDGTGRGDLNLYNKGPVQRAWGHVYEKQKSNRVLTP